MITLLLTSMHDVDMPVVLGYILSALEILYVACRVLLTFAPEGSEFEKVLMFILHKIPKAKEEVEDLTSKGKKNKKGDKK